MQIRFRDLKRDQYALCKELGYWKADRPKAKGKNKELITKVILAQVVSTHVGILQEGSHSDSSVFFSLLLLLLLVTQIILSGP